MKRATVRCAACRGMLGVVTGHEDGFVFFMADDPRDRRRMRQQGFDRRGSRSSTMLTNPRFSATWPVPEFLDVWCRKCGPGRVTSDAVRHATGKVYLDIT